MISLGIDQSMYATGMCVVQFGSTGVSVYLRSQTVATPDYNAMRDALIAFIGLDTVTVVTAEDAFMGKSPAAHKAAIRSATWVEATCCQYKIGEMFDIVTANEWRAQVWGKGKGGMKRDDAKAYSVEFAESHGLIDLDNNQGDAFGLSLCGMHRYLEATL